MANTVLPNTFQYPNIYIDRLAYYLSSDELAVLSVAVREILGWFDTIEGKTRTIAISVFTEGKFRHGKPKTEENRLSYGCGLSANTVRKAIAVLDQYQILVKTGKVTLDGQEFILQMDVDQIDWKGLEKRKKSRDRKNAKRTQKATKASIKSRGVTSHVTPSRATLGVTCDVREGVTSHDDMETHETQEKNEGDGDMDESAEFFGNNPNSNADLPQAVDKHQRMVDAAGGSQADDPVEAVAGHHYQGFMGAPVPLPPGKAREKWSQAAQRLLKRLPAGWELRQVCEAIDYWWVNTPDGDQFWTSMPCKDETLDLIAKYYIQRNTLQDEPPEEFSGAADIPKKREKAPHEAVWAAAVSELKLQMTKNTFDTLIRPTQALGRKNGTLEVAVQSDYAKEWIDSRLKAMILRTLQGIQPEIEDVVFIAL